MFQKLSYHESPSLGILRPLPSWTLPSALASLGSSASHENLLTPQVQSETGLLQEAILTSPVLPNHPLDPTTLRVFPPQLSAKLCFLVTTTVTFNLYQEPEPSIIVWLPWTLLWNKLPYTFPVFWSTQHRAAPSGRRSSANGWLNDEHVPLWCIKGQGGYSENSAAVTSCFPL